VLQSLEDRIERAFGNWYTLLSITHSLSVFIIYMNVIHTSFSSLWTRFLWLGCVLANCGTSLPPDASILCQTLVASCGSKHAWAISCKPILSASVSHLREKGIMIPKFSISWLKMKEGSMPMRDKVTWSTNKIFANDSFSPLCLASWCAISCPSTAAIPSTNINPWAFRSVHQFALSPYITFILDNRYDASKDKHFSTRKNKSTTN